MRFEYTPELREHMRKRGRSTIVVEMVEINNTDLEVSEFHVQLVDEKRREYFLTKKRYRLFTTEEGEVLLPRFPLEIEDTVTLGLKSFLWFKMLTCKGIKI